jgi:hypothetical protein
MSVTLTAHYGNYLVKESHHTHEIDIHLKTGIVRGSKLQRSAYAHSGIADKSVNAAFGFQDLVYSAFQ